MCWYSRVVQVEASLTSTINTGLQIKHANECFSAARAVKWTRVYKNG